MKLCKYNFNFKLVEDILFEKNLNLIVLNVKVENFWILKKLFNYNRIIYNYKYDIILNQLNIDKGNNLYYILFNNKEFDSIINKILSNKFYFINEYITICYFIYNNICINFQNSIFFENDYIWNKIFLIYALIFYYLEYLLFEFLIEFFIL